MYRYRLKKKKYLAFLLIFKDSNDREDFSSKLKIYWFSLIDLAVSQVGKKFVGGYIPFAFPSRIEFDS